ncbi:autotransporter domain-containing protein [Caulobacter sp. 17J65-9]|uniref:autotransporter domain-containing protein n=1 Tax=Caulobacter sp. 17J65-9 TaxID=2709382 RepID=UPI0013C5A752|nr:autotransporter domain-containing protein [Caulobacter sp. 17J65-9]NEX92822.1 autotransporter domain-containing protein [Caulobacter sp. 17J65-9]
MLVGIARGVRTSSRRRTLLLGTALGVSIAALAAAAPERAFAADECGAVPAEPVPTVTCAAAGSPYAGVEYGWTDPVDDLTVVLGEDVVVEGAVNLRGAGDIVLDGLAGSSVNDGVFVVGQGSASVTVGSVTAAGDAVVARSTYGSVTIVSGEVASTNGRGVWATARAEGATISVTSDSVVVQGGDGIFADASGGYADVHIDSGYVSAYAATGIRAFAASGYVEVLSDEIATTGEAAFGVSVVATDGGAHIDSGSITTDGLGSGGIRANSETSDLDIESDSITMEGDYATGIHAVSGSGTVTVDSGAVVAHGASSNGIVVATESGDIHIDSDTIIADGGSYSDGYSFGPMSVGIDAQSDTGDITIVSGDISVVDGAGIRVSTAGNISVTSTGTITVAEGESGAGEPADGIHIDTGDEAYAGDVAVLNSGRIEMHGDGRGGVFVDGFYADVTVTNDEDGSILVHGDDAAGIGVYTNRAVTISNAGLIHQYGDGAGIRVQKWEAEGAVSVSNAGSIVTEGRSAAAVEVLAFGGAISIVGTGTIETHGDYASGIDAWAEDGLVSIDVASVRTSGVGAVGIEAFSRTGDVHVVADLVTTTNACDDDCGDGYADGVSVQSESGDIKIEVGSVTTAATGARGVVVDASGSSEVEILSDEIETAGDAAVGVRVSASQGPVSVTSGSIVTHGDGAFGMEIYAHGGDVVVDSETVSTTGDASAGIWIVSDADEGGDVSVTSGTVVTSGADSHGVFVGAGPGDVDVEVGSVTVSGAQSYGVRLESVLGDISLEAGTVRALGGASDAISAYSQAGDVAITVGDEASSAAGAGVNARAAAGGVEITLDAGSEVRGEDVGVRAYSATGTTITINGTVRADSGLAIDVKGAGAATIHNASNTVVGGVSLTDSADLFDNSGTFRATIDSQFGGGVDRFANSGLLQVRPDATTPGVIVFAGLEVFDNAGTVSLANGHVGDVLDLSSAAWHGLAGSTVRMDLSSGGSDTLRVGSADGQTTLALTRIGGGEIAEALELVVSSADETGDEFVLDGDLGMVDYTLSFDAETNTWTAVGAADEEVFEPARVAAGAQNFWRATGDVWSARMAELRDIGSSRGAGPQGWAQVFAGEQSEDRGLEHFTVGGVATTADLSYEQSFRGLQTGLDWATGDAVVGLSVGFAGADQRMASGNSAEFDGFNLGVYGGWTKGAFFLNGLAKLDVFDIRLGLETMGETRKIGGHALGAKLEGGWRAGGDGWFVEPTARLAWIDADLDGFAVEGSQVEFGDASSLRAELGGRVGTRWATGVADLAPYVGLYGVREFDAESRTTVRIAGDAFHLTDPGAEPFGRAELGVTALAFHGLEASAKAEALFGGDAGGYAARLGVRWRW